MPSIYSLIHIYFLTRCIAKNCDKNLSSHDRIFQKVSKYFRHLLFFLQKVFWTQKNLSIIDGRVVYAKATSWKFDMTIKVEGAEGNCFVCPPKSFEYAWELL